MEMGSGLLVMRRSRFRFPEAALTKTAAWSATARCQHPRHRSNVRKVSPKCPRGLAEHPAEVLGLLRLQLRSHEKRARSAAVADGRVAALPRGLPVATDQRDD